MISLTARRNRRQGGFTLAELAITLVVVGLILGGVLMGQDLIQGARLQAVMREVEGFRAPIYTFQDRYQALPGDKLDRDAEQLMGEAGGDGDGIIGGLVTDVRVALGGDDRRLAENRHFWNHLTTAGLLRQGIRPSLSPAAEDDPSNHRFGILFPRSRLPSAGYTTIRFTADEGTPTARTAYWVRLHRNPTGEATGALSPTSAADLDRMMDDGFPNSGQVRAFDGGDTCRDPEDPSRYARSDAEGCILLFEIF